MIARAALALALAAAPVAAAAQNQCAAARALVNADGESVDLSCTWRPADYATATALFDDLFERLQSCLSGRLTPPTGPTPYGGQTALRSSSTEIERDGTETAIGLLLIESPHTGGNPAYHYITLSVGHVPPERLE